MTKEERKLRRRENRRKKWPKQQNEENFISTRNAEGYLDYTPFNTLTGKEVLSKTNIINPQKRVSGSYNG